MEKRWLKTTQSLAARPALLQTVFASVLAPMHNEAHRTYHNFQHISHLLDLIETHYKAANVDALTLNLTAWFHDAVYNPKKKNNEEQSAQLAEKWLPQIGVSDAMVKHVAHIIRRTANHTQNDSSDTAETLFFLDADLVILGSSSEHYTKYHQAIRAEYSHVPSLFYKPGRRKVLQAFIDAPFLYRTEPFRSLYEAKARKNLTAEIALLQ